MTKWMECLLRNGVATYAAYLRSEHWLSFRAEWHRINPDAVCECCGAKKVHLHHHTYERLGNESMDDITPLCGDCHLDLHKLLKKARRSVHATQWAIMRMKGCLWISRKLSREEQAEKDAEQAALTTRATRSAYAKFWRTVPKAERPPPVLKIKKNKNDRAFARRIAKNA